MTRGMFCWLVGRSLGGGGPAAHPDPPRLAPTRVKNYIYIYIYIQWHGLYYFFLNDDASIDLIAQGRGNICYTVAAARVRMCMRGGWVGWGGGFLPLSIFAKKERKYLMYV